MHVKHIRRLRSKVLDLDVQVSVPLTTDTVSAAVMQAWLQEAVNRYHEFRAGWVGDAQTLIKCPTVHVSSQ